METSEHSAEQSYTPRKSKDVDNSKLQQDLAAEVKPQKENTLSWAYTVGKEGVDYRTVLSEDAQKLLDIVNCEVAWTDALPMWAKREGIDLKNALNELRHYELIDESDSREIKLLKKPNL